MDEQVDTLTCVWCCCLLAQPGQGVALDVGQGDRT